MERDTYLDGLPGLTFTSSIYLAVDRPIVVDAPYSEANDYNYCYVDNPAYPDVPALGPDEVRYCYFVTGCEYASPGACRLTLMLDVWTTYAGFVRFNKQYVERGHVPWLNTPSLSTQNLPETLRKYWLPCDPLDVGTKYVDVYNECLSLQDTAFSLYFVIASTVDLTASYGTISNANLTASSGGSVDGLYSACQLLAGTPGEVLAALTYLKNYPWISQNIVAIYVLPSQVLDVSSATVQMNGSDGPTVLHPCYGKHSTISDNSNILKEINLQTFLPSYVYDSRILAFYTSKWITISLESGSGAQVTLAPELSANNTMAIYLLTCMCYPWVEAAVFPLYYGSQIVTGYSHTYRNAQTVNQSSIPYGDFLDSALWLTDWPQFGTVNNNALLSLAQTAAARHAAGTSASLAYKTATTAAGISKATEAQALQSTYDLETQQATQSYNSNYVFNRIGDVAGRIGYDLNRAVAAPFEMVAQGIPAFIGAIRDQLASGSGSNIDAASAVANEVATDAVASIMAQYPTSEDYQTAFEMEQSRRDLALQNSLLSNSRNNEIATMQAKTNYQSTMLALQAQEQAAQISAPGISGQHSGPGLMFKYGLTNTIRLHVKRPMTKYCAMAKSYMLRYGWPVQAWVNVPLDLRLMSMATYWKMPANTIQVNKGTVTVRDTIRGIFARGVTVWRQPSFIGSDLDSNDRFTSREGTYYTIS